MVPGHHGLGFRVQGSEFMVKGSGFMLWGSGFRALGSEFRVQGSGFRVQGSGFRAQSSGCRVQGAGLPAGLDIHLPGSRRVLAVVKFSLLSLSKVDRFVLQPQPVNV